MSGYRIIKFTGSEVFKDANNCVTEILKYIQKDYERVGKEYGTKENV